jgi:hypothetical protein
MTLSQFAFPFFGRSYRQIFVNSDGNLTFQAGDSASTQRSLGNVVAGVPRIAPCTWIWTRRKLRMERVLSEAGRVPTICQRTPCSIRRPLGVHL